MPVSYKITITRNILSLSKNCGCNGEISSIGNNCAIAIALKDLFPSVHVKEDYILPFGIDPIEQPDLKIPLPEIARQFIKLFDGFRLTPRLRLLLPEFEFIIEIPDEVIDQINISELTGCFEGDHLRYPQEEKIPDTLQKDYADQKKGCRISVGHTLIKL